MFTVEFTIGNSAFADGFTEEVERIFSKILQEIHQGKTQGLIKDLNGNHVGQWSYSF